MGNAECGMRNAECGMRSMESREDGEVVVGDGRNWPVEAAVLGPPDFPAAAAITTIRIMSGAASNFGAGEW